ncbi:hypothetical protein [Oceanirhabdus sp. W0125-5]|uniref:hypothetical protein n=1 Tax=Oceanirhabdus sp. W0125-5 TaxID=2999116 RepID=UPI0022F3290A|nr:hypothetical protein [Oceanirhabdus sp. W0125-5]WBW95972.1 hypothetical protein OW730_20100 [Oceanirhabdus sp. W0125-5]
MELRNEKSKIYILGCSFLRAAVFGLALIYFINRSNRELAKKLFVIQQISLGLFFILSGIRKVSAQKDKKGYFDCFLGAAILMAHLIHLSLTFS